MYSIMAVRQLKNGKWIATVDMGNKWDGARDRKSAVRGTKKEAEKAERQLLIKKDRNRGVSNRISFAEFVHEVYWPAKSMLRANTKRCYERDIKLRLMPAFGAMDLGDINRLHIQRMISNCATKKVATNARETLSSILGLAADLDMLPRNPAASSYNYPPQPSSAPDKDGVWLTSFAEHRRLLEHAHKSAPESVEKMLVLGLCFGLRKGEIFGLDWSTVDFIHKEIRIVQTYTIAQGGASLNPPKTENSKRTIPMTDYAYKSLKSWYRTGNVIQTGPVVKGQSGGRYNPHTADNAMRRFTGSNDVPRVTLMSLRHSFATASMRAGIEVSSVAKWLGHRDVSTTYNRYVRPMLANLHDDAGKINEAFLAAK
ncbi:MAG: tyrosine-type recombinase/integrase [Raoultibacter sp.]